MEKPTEPKQEEVEKTPESKETLIINPNQVQNSTGKEIDYEKVIKMFGLKTIDEAMLQRIEKLTGKKPHYFLTREIFFTHR
jgi:tryptophanyl-tRNA synthetase